MSRRNLTGSVWKNAPLLTIRLVERFVKLFRNFSAKRNSLTKLFFQLVVSKVLFSTRKCSVPHGIVVCRLRRNHKTAEHIHKHMQKTIDSERHLCSTEIITAPVVYWSEPKHEKEHLLLFLQLPNKWKIIVQHSKWQVNGTSSILCTSAPVIRWFSGM